MSTTVGTAQAAIGERYGAATEADGPGIPPAVLHHETYDLPGQAEHVRGYEKRIRGFYDGVGLETSWMQRVATRFGSVAGLRGRDRLRQAMHQLGFPLR